MKDFVIRKGIQIFFAAFNALFSPFDFFALFLVNTTLTTPFCTTAILSTPTRPIPWTLGPDYAMSLPSNSVSVKAAPWSTGLLARALLLTTARISPTQSSENFISRWKAGIVTAELFMQRIERDAPFQTYSRKMPQQPITLPYYPTATRWT